MNKDMTQYEKEDQTEDSRESALENLRATRDSLSTSVQTAADMLNRSSEVTQWLYGRQQDGDDAALVAEQHQKFEALSTMVTRLHIAFEGAMAFGLKMDEYGQQIAGVLDDLEDAAYQGDDSHPILRDFAEGVREQHYTDMVEFAKNDAEQVQYYNLWTELHERLSFITGSKDWVAIGNFCNLVLGDDPHTRRQQELFNQLLGTMNQQTPDQKALIQAYYDSFPKPTEQQQELMNEILQSFAEQAEARAS